MLTFLWGDKCVRGSSREPAQSCLEPLAQTFIIFRSFSQAREASLGHCAFFAVHHTCTEQL